MTSVAMPMPIEPTLVDTADPRGLGGLVAAGTAGEVALPLASVTVRASIAGDCARTVISQRFRNTLPTPMEAVHIFPLPHDGAVTEVELRCGELVVRAECREKFEAQRIFDEAREAGHRAALLTADRDDVHTLRVTNLPPGDEVTVRIVVVQRLEASDGRLRWRFPTTIAPRYLPGQPIGHSGDGVLPDTDHAPDASRLQPPLRLDGGTELDLEVEISGPLSSLESSLHAVKIDFDGGIRVAPSGKATLNKDFILSLSTGRDDVVGARAYTDGNHTLVLVEPPLVELPDALPRDAVFVVDISGSMGGIKMDAAKSALKAALHGLMPGDRFMLIAFDDRVERFAADFTAYSDASLQRADRWIAGLSARGGTEMLAPIKAALAGKTPLGRVRTVLFITDGQAWNEAELVAAVANRREGSRFFTLGIDTAVNSSLLSKLADVGGGTAELAAPGDDIEAVIVRLEARFGSPVVEGLRIPGHMSARLRDEVLFSGRPASILVEGAPETVVIEGRTVSGVVALEAAVERIDFPIGALWARERVAGLQQRLVLKPFEEEALRPQIIEVALAHSIASRFTSFVAVERSTAVDGGPVRVVQPAELPESWDRDGLAMGGAAQGGTPKRKTSKARRRAGGMPRPAPMAPPPGYVPGPTSAPAPMKQVSMPSAARPAAKGEGTGGVFSRAASAISGLFGGASGSQDFEAEEEADGTAFFSRDRAPARELAVEPEPEEAALPTDPGARLAVLQTADGSFGTVEATVAALVTLVLQGHTRRSGLRRRVVLKAAKWLAQHRGTAIVDDALALLTAAEKGARPGAISDAIRALAPSHPELQAALRQA